MQQLTTSFVKKKHRTRVNTADYIGEIDLR